MCRFMAYMGHPMLLAHLVLWPDRSIIKQSYSSKERLNDPDLPGPLCHGNINADGFGIGWYTESSSDGSDDTPCIFTSISPAWNNDNLRRLSCKISSSLVYAHVRAAYPDMPINEQSCHPFSYKKYMWMHNGNIGGFFKIRRQLLSMLSDVAFDAIQTFDSDSAVAFGIFLNMLPDLDKILEPIVLLNAMEKTISTILKIQKENNITEVSLLNFALTDGYSMIATRFVSPSSQNAASLYYSEGSTFEPLTLTSTPITSPFNGSSEKLEDKYKIGYSERGTSVVIIASEPITHSVSDWVKVPKNTALIVSREKSSYVNVMKAKFDDDGTIERKDETCRCLEAIRCGIKSSARTWSLKDDKESTWIAQVHEKTPKKISEEEMHTLTGHKAPILDSMVDIKENTLFTASADGTIRRWDMNNYNLLSPYIKAHKKAARRIYEADKCVISMGGRRIRLWNIGNDMIDNIIAECEPGIGTYRCLKVRNGKIFVGCQDASLSIIDLKNKNNNINNFYSSTKEKEHHLSIIHALEICDDYICTAGGDAMIKLWSPETLEYKDVLRGHKGSILTLRGSGKMLVSGGRDNTVKVWDLETKICRKSLIGHQDDIVRINIFHPLSNLYPELNQYIKDDEIIQKPLIIASCSADCTIRLWLNTSLECEFIFELMSSSVSDDYEIKNHAYLNCMPLCVNMTTEHLIAGTSSGNIILWKIRDEMKEILINELSQENNLIKLESYGCKHKKAHSKEYEDKLACMHKTYFEKEFEKHLKVFVSLKTVSSNPCLKEDNFQGAKFLSHILEDLGAEVKLVQTCENRNPVVIGRSIKKKEYPTVLFYGHYDVQPAEEIGWETNPYTLILKDGYYYGRGTSDNKGPILAFIYAIREILEEERAMQEESCNIKFNTAFFFEGEEENGSCGSLKALEDNLHWFNNIVLTIISNTQWVGENEPCLTYGMRGMLSIDVKISGPARDLHSGNDGGVFNEPFVDLVKVLSTLLDSQTNICIPGFYDNIRTDLLYPAWESLKESNEFSMNGYKKALGVPSLISSNSKRDILDHRWCKPTLSIVEMRIEETSNDESKKSKNLSCQFYRFGPSRYSVIPKSAVGKLSVRFVPDQNITHLFNCIKKHIEHEFSKLRSKNKIESCMVTSGDWWEAKKDSKYFYLAEKAIKDVWNKNPLYVREGGTMPIASSIEKILNCHTLVLPMGQASDNCHLANERIRRLNLIKGKDVVKNILQQISQETN